MDVHDVVLLEKLFTLKGGYLEAVDGEDRFRDDTDPQDDRDVSPTIPIPNDIDARKFHSLRLQDVDDKGCQLILPEVVERMVTDAFSSLRTGYASGSVGSFHGVVGVLERATKRGWEGNPV